MDTSFFRSLTQFLYHTSSLPFTITYVEFIVQRFRRRNPWGLMPPEAPPLVPRAKKPPKAPRGFRFASEPPDLNDIIHLDNDHPYLRSRKGERVEFRDGHGLQAPLLNIGTVVGRMNSDDPRARVVNSSTPGAPGLFIQELGCQPRWYPCQRIYRELDGFLCIRK